MYYIVYDATLWVTLKVSLQNGDPRWALQFRRPPPAVGPTPPRCGAKLRRSPALGSGQEIPGPCRANEPEIWGHTCNLLRPLIKIPFLWVPYGYITIKIKQNS